MAQRNGPTLQRSPTGARLHNRGEETAQKRDTERDGEKVRCLFLAKRILKYNYTLMCMCVYKISSSLHRFLLNMCTSVHQLECVLTANRLKCIYIS